MKQAFWMKSSLIFLTMIITYSHNRVIASGIAKEKRNIREQQPVVLLSPRNDSVNNSKEKPSNEAAKLTANSRLNSVERTSREGSGGRSAELLNFASNELKSASSHVTTQSLFSEEEFLQHFSERKRQSRSVRTGYDERIKAKTSKSSDDHKELKGCHRHKKQSKRCIIAAAHYHQRKDNKSHNSQQKTQHGHLARAKRSLGNKIGIVDIFGLSKTTEKPRRKPVIFTDFITDEVIHVQPKYKL